MAVYLLHFDKPFGHARHYLGWASNLEARLRHHGTKDGANLLWHARRAGITWECVRVWPDADRNYERRLKNNGSSARYCPVCCEATQTTVRGLREKSEVKV